MAYSDIVLANSPAAYWRLEETSGTTAEDSTANNRDLTLVNTPTLDVAGAISGSKAMTFTGSSSEYGYTADHAVFAWGTACSFEGWIKTTSTASNQVIVSQWNTDYAFWLGFESAGQATCRVRIASTNYTAQASGNWHDGQWHHVAGVRDGTSLKLYVDGILRNTATVASGAIDSATSNVEIARVAGSAYTTASLDEIAVYTTALSASDVWDRYEARLSAYAREVIADAPEFYWRFGEGSGTVAHDEMGVLNGSFVNTPTLGSASLIEVDSDNASATFVKSSSEYVSVADHANMDTATFSLECWLKTSTTTGDMGVIARDDNSSNRFWEIRVASSILKFLVFNTAGSYTWFTTTFNVADGNPHHVVATFDGSTLKVYVDNVMQSTAFSGTVKSSGTQAIYIGSIWSTSYTFDGVLDEVAFYDYVLTSTQVGAHYNAAAEVSISVANALHALTSGDPLAPIAIELLVADALHALASLNMTMDLPLDLANAIHDLVSENVTMDIALATAWGTHSHAAQVMVLDQLHNLLVRAASHAHRATASSFIQAHLLATQDAEHFCSDNLTLDMPLAIDGAGHSSSSNSPAWSQVHVLTGMSGWHRVSSDALKLPPGLHPANAEHGHTAGEVTLLEAVFIQAASVLHAQLAQVGGFVPQLVVASGAHSVDSTGSVEAWLAAQDAGHAHSAGNLTLSQLHQLVVAAARHAQSAGAVTFAQAHTLVVQSSEHGVLSNGTMQSRQIDTADSRVFIVPPEDRVYVVPADKGTTNVVDLDNRWNEPV